MLKKTITYTDYDGNERKEDFYFNLTKAELLEMELSTPGGMEKMIQNILDAQDLPELIKMFKKLILLSYGKKSDDGKRFIKSDILREEFTQTEAYSDLFMELSMDADAATEFINGIIPDSLDMEKEMKKYEQNNVIEMNTENNA